MKFNRILLLIVVAFVCSLHSKAQQKYPSTFLWRISGKGLTAPSYLYGTMHLQDRRLFYFGDSLYTAIENTKSFAIEINPVDFMDSLINRYLDNDTTSSIKKLMDDKEFKRVAKELEKKFKMPAEKITIKKLRDENNKLVYKSHKADDMPTPMDLYLYNIAELQGKYTSGIEDVSDQLGIFDAMGKTDLNTLIKNDSTTVMTGVEEMKQVYINHNLSRLDSMVNGYGTFFKDIMLIKRNKKMAVRIDSLMQLRTGFFAVGAAHLPGDSGVISLLRKRGFTVEPVIPSKYLAPGEYKNAYAKEAEWLTIQDNNKFYTIKMPGKPMDINSELLPMKLNVDLGTLSVYGIGATPVARNNDTQDSAIFARILNNYKEKGYEILSKKEIVYKDAKALEVISKLKTDQNYRMRILIANGQLVMVIFGAANKDSLYTVNAGRFFNSLELAKDMSVVEKKWQTFKDDNNAFQFEMPGEIKKEVQKGENGTSTVKYHAVDYVDGSYYSVIVFSTQRGYMILNDSTDFEEYKGRLNQSYQNGVKEFVQLKKYGMPACKFVAQKNQDGVDYIIQGYEFRRGSRTYLQMVVTLKEKAGDANVTRFTESLSFLHYQETGWNKYQVPGTALTTMAPAAFEKVQKDSVEEDNGGTRKYQVRDPYTGITFSCEVEPLSKYYWVKSDTGFFRNICKSYKGYYDSLLYYSYNDGAVKNAEVLIKVHGTALYKKLKVFLNGDTSYSLYSYFPAEVKENAYFDKFYTETSFSRNFPTSIFQNKAALLLAALKNADSTNIDELQSQLRNVEFSKEDLPLLYNALSKKYFKSPTQYRSINEAIAEKIEKLDDSKRLDYIIQQYPVKNDSTENIQCLLLKMLAKYKTAASFNQLKTFILQQPPVKGYTNDLAYPLIDSLELAASLFPEITKVFDDTLLGPVFAYVANTLLDSNKINLSSIQNNEQGVYALARYQLKMLKKDKDESSSFETSVIGLLQKLNTKTANDLLQQYANLNDEQWIRIRAVIALLKNNQQPPIAAINSLAADKTMRIIFYNDLKTINKTAAFPKTFYTQAKFAEGYLYTSLPDNYDLDVQSARFLKTVTAEVNGKTQRYYLYTVVFDEEETDPHLAICGPFNMNAGIAEINENDVDVYCDTDNPYSAKSVDEVFKNYINDKKTGAKGNSDQ